ncbi:MAG TPA: cysteine synthase family protein, partial [Saprospiraceae bacterium]|nr:cysteine synthase family protein [Saprospiraceae bacterium]
MSSPSHSILDAIGNTHIVELKHLAPPHSARILAKVESANPTGSMKDRMARTVIERASEKGFIKPGSTIVEYTAGTTGISLAFVCAALGYQFHAVFSDAFSNEKRITMKAYGATITDVPSDNKKITAQLIKSMIGTARTLSEQENTWWADQLNNRDAETGYYGLGDEIWTQTGGEVDAFVHTVSTAHSLHGVTKALWKHNPRIRIYAVEPTESAVLSGRPSGSHQIEGIGIGFVPPLWQPALVNEIMTVSTEEAMQMARRLAREEGIFAGTSTGANIVAALRVAGRLGPGKTVVTIIVDSGLRYVSTDVYRAV